MFNSIINQNLDVVFSMVDGRGYMEEMCILIAQFVPLNLCPTFPF